MLYSTNPFKFKQIVSSYWGCRLYYCVNQLSRTFSPPFNTTAALLILFLDSSDKSSYSWNYCAGNNSAGSSCVNQISGIFSPPLNITAALLSLFRYDCNSTIPLFASH